MYTLPAHAMLAALPCTFPHPLRSRRQHLHRQEGSLKERMQRLEAQSALRKEAAASGVEQQRAQKEAVQAANDAAEAQMQENEAQARALREQARIAEAQHEANVTALLEKVRELWGVLCVASAVTDTVCDVGLRVKKNLRHVIIVTACPICISHLSLPAVRGFAGADAQVPRPHGLRYADARRRGQGHCALLRYNTAIACTMMPSLQ